VYVTGEKSAGSSSDIFVPRNIDVTCCLESGGKCCYALHALCKFGVGLCEIVSLVCSGLSIMEIKKCSNTAQGLIIGSAVSSAAGLGLTYALFKTGNKMRKLDKAFGTAPRANGYLTGEPCRVGEARLSLYLFGGLRNTKPARTYIFCVAENFTP
jgi:hypothetical protein